MAHTGTLFLDEIGEMPMETQAKLLRVLQDGMVDRIGSTHPLAVDVRVIAATNADLSAAIRQGTFRADLYHRLHIFPISVPRFENVARIFRSSRSIFSRRSAPKLKRPHLTFDTQSMARLLTYNWPGNVRELQNVIERAIILPISSRVTVGDVASTRQHPPKQHGVTPVNLGDLERHHMGGGPPADKVANLW